MERNINDNNMREDQRRMERMEDMPEQRRRGATRSGMDRTGMTMNMHEMRQVGNMSRGYASNGENVDAIEDIYKTVNRRMCEALEFHMQLIDYFRFLGLQGFKRMAEFQYMKECAEKAKLHKRYIDMHHRIIPVETVPAVNIIPNEWARYTTKEIDDSAVSKYTRMILKEWCEWEEETKKHLEDLCAELTAIGAHADVDFFHDLIVDSEKELKKVHRLYEQMNGTGYDVTAIHSTQDKYHEKFKKKYNEHFTNKSMKYRSEPVYEDDDYRRRRIGY